MYTSDSDGCIFMSSGACACRNIVSVYLHNDGTPKAELIIKFQPVFASLSEQMTGCGECRGVGTLLQPRLSQRLRRTKEMPEQQ